ncbi:MAG: type II toxin-antitoxin system Phd/YefM family antitoxin [Abitibacteriaceae bacterium]|nr:type II toxin-antitoxin system Phd/YefM family antitoxin [Abditibacteriaceae bacterium]
MQQVSLDEAKTQLPDLVDAALNGAEVVIAKDNQQLVKLVPLETIERRPRFGSAKGLIVMNDDFDEPLEEFKEYME